MKVEKPSRKERWRAIVRDFEELVFVPVFYVLVVLAFVGGVITALVAAWTHFIL